jgi:uncharacterized RDD family membrane protein YckC
MPIPDPIAHREFYEGIASKRLFAWVLDTVIIIAISIVIVPFTAFTGLFFFPLLMFVIGFFYRVTTLASGSATWGMRAFAMELRDREDKPLDGSLALLHTLGYSLSFAVFPVQVISMILIATSATRQGLTDLFLGTVALNRRRSV